MSQAPKALFCPICRKVVLATDPDFPFCSERCRVIDLGKWASGGYVISSPIHDPDLLDELEGLRDRQHKTRTDED
ncbi:DNA gyrase inhibitor YacG [Granulicella sp. WH15]|uniref:DNA gyrase inhibitor YacG n=1 Tax=Granulicella sp. WH15 TaxID=2602070 RepID=UPI0013675969|nr:DNA gyrase inhibitor YacG [Granulicella sp. WH15]QHN02308.1 DNA gyrase inhibitor YacG [Granulicella sp. WH15]